MKPEKATPTSTSWIVWRVLLASQFLHLLVALSLSVKAQEPVLLLPLTVAAATMGAAALGLFFVWGSAERQEQWARDARQAGKGPAEVEVLLGQRRMQVQVLSWALAEMVTLLGLALRIVGQATLEQFALFLAAGVVIQALCRPRA